MLGPKWAKPGAVIPGPEVLVPNRSGADQLRTLDVHLSQPARCHWLRAPIRAGVCFGRRFQTVTQMVRVWRNECLRVFHDRLINEADKNLVGLFSPLLLIELLINVLHCL